jgi:anti-anti-sigma factor
MVTLDRTQAQTNAEINEAVYGNKGSETAALEIEVDETVPSIPVLRITGEVDLHTCPELRSALQRLTENEKKYIVLDMAAVPYVDSAALGVLVDAQRRVKEKEGEIFLAQVTPFVMRAFEITRLIRIFQTRDTLAAALELAKTTAGAP